MSVGPDPEGPSGEDLLRLSTGVVAAYVSRNSVTVDAIPDIIRTATNLLPPDLEVVRIVDIVGLDTQADGGTHVASTAMVGRVEVVKMENKGRGFRRLRIRIL